MLTYIVCTHRSIDMCIFVYLDIYITLTDIHMLILISSCVYIFNHEYKQISAVTFTYIYDIVIIFILIVIFMTVITN